MKTEKLISIIEQFGGKLKWDEFLQAPVWSGKKPGGELYKKILAVLKEHKPNIVEILRKQEQNQ
jgi:hypothetical protein